MSFERGDLRTETESEITAAQDQTLQTKYHLKNYYKQLQIANEDYVNCTRQ